MTDKPKEFHRKSRVYIPPTTPSLSEIQREKDTKELLECLEKLKKKRIFIFIFRL
jgi:hypothetical protein